MKIKKGWDNTRKEEKSKAERAGRREKEKDPFGQNLTDTARTISDRGGRGGGLGHLWKNASESEKGKLHGSGPVAFCQKPGPMIPAHRLDSGTDVYGQNLIRPSRSDPDRFCTV